MATVRSDRTYDTVVAVRTKSSCKVNNLSSVWTFICEAQKLGKTINKRDLIMVSQQDPEFKIVRVGREHGRPLDKSEPSAEVQDYVNAHPNLCTIAKLEVYPYVATKGLQPAALRQRKKVFCTSTQLRLANIKVSNVNMPPCWRCFTLKIECLRHQEKFGNKYKDTKCANCRNADSKCVPIPEACWPQVKKEYTTICSMSLNQDHAQFQNTVQHQTHGRDRKRVKDSQLHMERLLQYVGEMFRLPKDQFALLWASPVLALGPDQQIKPSHCLSPNSVDTIRNLLFKHRSDVGGLDLTRIKQEKKKEEKEDEEEAVLFETKTE